MPNISLDTKLQTVITTFEMTPGTCQDLLDELKAAYADFIRHQKGFIGAAIHVNDAQTRIANYSQWQQREDFLAMLRYRHSAFPPREDSQQASFLPWVCWATI